MKSDLEQTFGQVFNNNHEAFQQQLLAVSKLQTDRKKAEKWVEDLRYLDISNIPTLKFKRRKSDLHHKKRIAVPVSAQEADRGGKYVAVSWPWGSQNFPPPHGCDTRTRYSYSIRRHSGTEFVSFFPDWYMERVILFAQSRNITKIWIDTECIFQRSGDKILYPVDQQLGVQIMDVVYGDCTCAVGLLTAVVTEQDEVNLLAALMSRTIFVSSGDIVRPRLKQGTKRKALLSMISKIFQDPRWNRGWIFQEDHLASDRMVLLIPHSEHIDKPNTDIFGDIDGDLQIDLSRLKQAVTMLCLALRGYKEKELIDKHIRRGMQYNIQNKVVGKAAQGHPSARKKHERDLTKGKVSSAITFHPTTTMSVMDDINGRKLVKETDRLAVLPNALRFSRRLDVSEKSPIVRSDQYSLSTALLATILLNGEILRNDVKMSTTTFMGLTLREYLNKCQCFYPAPGPRYQQSFIDKIHYRLPEITSRGAETMGCLFRLYPRTISKGRHTKSYGIRLTETDRARLQEFSTTRRGRRLIARVIYVIELVSEKLKRRWRGCDLATFIDKCLLQLVRKYSPGKTPTQRRYILDAMFALHTALLDNREVRLARPAEDPWFTNPTAIFIMPSHRTWPSESSRAEPRSHDGDDLMVFTSWNKGRGPYEKESITSLKVSVYAGNGRSADRNVLRNHGWVNGLWNIEGRTMKTYVFPLPGITTVHGFRGSKKRKRIDD